MIRLLIGGSPCTHWSVAQTKNRETQPNSGLGWELFLNYKIALEKWKPDYFLYENNKSASQAIKNEIAKELNVVTPDLFTEDNGVRMTHINSSLVSGQHRERFYVTNFGDIPMPEDRGILLQDVLDGVAMRDKARTVISSIGRTTDREYFEKHQNTMAAEPIRVGCMPSPDGTIKNSQAFRIYGIDGKSVTQSAQGGGAGGKTGLYAVPVYAGEIPGHNGKYRNGKQPSQQYRVYDTCGKSPAVTADANANIAVPVNPLKSGKARCVTSGYANKGAKHILESNYSDNPAKQTWDSVAEIVALNTKDGKSQTIKAQCQQTNEDNIISYAGSTFGASGVAEAVNLYAEPIEWDDEGRPIKAISGADGKVYRVYEVKDGKIEIKGKLYPIKLPDGFWLIRKLTVEECKRLQTIPDWYEFPVSDSQAYKQIGNGWTIEVIKHLLSQIPNIQNEEIEVLSMYDGMSCGQIALKELGCNVVKYYATEIDKYAIQSTQHNFPNTIQLGDAFQVRDEGWAI